MDLRFYPIKLLSIFLVTTLLSIGVMNAAENSNLETPENHAMQVLVNEGYAHAMFLPRLYRYVGLLCNRSNRAGREIAQHSDREAIALSSDGGYCAFTVNDEHCSVQVIDTRTGGLVRSLPGDVDNVTCLAFSPDDQYLFLGSSIDRTVFRWNFHTNDLIKVLTFPLPGLVPRLWLSKFSRDCRSVLVSYGASQLCWDLNSNNLIKAEDCVEAGEVEDFGPLPGQLLIRTLNQRICMWDYLNKRELVSCPIHCRDLVSDLSYCNNMIAATYAKFGGHRVNVDIVDSKTGTLLRSLLPRGARGGIRGFFIGDGFLAVDEPYRYGSALHIYDATTGRCVQELQCDSSMCPEHPAPVAADRYGQIAAIDRDGKVCLFNSIPENIREQLRSLPLNQLLTLRTIVESLACGPVIHSSKALALVGQMPEAIKRLVGPFILNDLT